MYLDLQSLLDYNNLVTFNGNFSCRSFSSNSLFPPFKPEKLRENFTLPKSGEKFTKLRELKTLISHHILQISLPVCETLFDNRSAPSEPLSSEE